MQPKNNVGHPGQCCSRHNNEQQASAASNDPPCSPSMASSPAGVVLSTKWVPCLMHPLLKSTQPAGATRSSAAAMADAGT
jgi:hypothetical protein